MTYKYAFEKRDISRIDKLNKLTNTNTFWEDVRKLCRGVTSDHAIGIPEIFGEVQRYGTTKCFITSIAEYFKKHGFTVELEPDNVNYNISI